MTLQPLCWKPIYIPRYEEYKEYRYFWNELEIYLESLNQYTGLNIRFQYEDILASVIPVTALQKFNYA